MDNDIKTPSDEELFSIYGVASTYAIYTDTDKAKRQKGIAAVRAAIEAPWRAEVERMKARIISEEKTNEIRNRMDVEIKEALQDALGQRFDSARIFPGGIAQLAEERDSLRAKLAEAEATIARHAEAGMKAMGFTPEQRTVPAAVTFACTDQDLGQEIDEAGREYLKHNQSHHVYCKLLGETARHRLTECARVAVPDGVPTAKDLVSSFDRMGYDPQFLGDWPGSIRSVIEDTYNRLSPFFARPVPEGSAEHELLHWKSLVCELTGRKNMNDAVETIEAWAKSVDPALCETELCFTNTLPTSRMRMEVKGYDKGQQAFISCLLGGEGKGFFIQSPADARRAGLWLLSFAAKHGEDVRLSPVTVSGQPDAEIYRGGKRLVPEPEPIAPPETLEQLAEIAYNQWFEKNRFKDWSGISDNARQYWIENVSTILANAGAYVDVSKDSIEALADEEDIVDWLNSRIRFRVQPQPCGECGQIELPLEITRGNTTVRISAGDEKVYLKADKNGSFFGTIFSCDPDISKLVGKALIAAAKAALEGG